MKEVFSSVTHLYVKTNIMLGNIIVSIPKNLLSKFIADWKKRA